MLTGESLESGSLTRITPFMAVALGIAALPTTRHNTMDEIITEAMQREEAGVELYRELLSLVKDTSVVLEEYATHMVAAEAGTHPGNGAYVDEARARLSSSYLRARLVR